jgi:hypothetical protein
VTLNQYGLLAINQGHALMKKLGTAEYSGQRYGIKSIKIFNLKVSETMHLLRCQYAD